MLTRIKNAIGSFLTALLILLVLFSIIILSDMREIKYTKTADIENIVSYMYNKVILQLEYDNFDSAQNPFEHLEIGWRNAETDEVAAKRQLGNTIVLTASNNQDAMLLVEHANEFSKVENYTLLYFPHRLNCVLIYSSRCSNAIFITNNMNLHDALDMDSTEYAKSITKNAVIFAYCYDGNLKFNGVLVTSKGNFTRPRPR